MAPRTTSDAPRCSAFAMTVALVLLATITSNLPATARASAIRPRSATSVAVHVDDGEMAVHVDDGEMAVHVDDGEMAVRLARHRRDVGPPTNALDVAKTAAAAVAATDGASSVRTKRSFKLLKLKPLILLPAKLALGTGHKLVVGAKLGAKAVGVGAKAVGAGLVGLKAVSKVAKVTVKAATALGIKAVLLNFLFHKINQVIDFKTRLLSNLDNKNRQQNAQFLSGTLSSKPVSGSIGNKDGFVPEPLPQLQPSSLAPLQPPQGTDTAIIDTQSFTSRIDPENFVAASNTQQNGFAPASDLIASAPPLLQQQQQQLQSDGSVLQPPGVPVNLEPFHDTLRYPYGPLGQEAAFAAANDDGTHSSETTF